jgi:hypothetical protein
MRDARTRRECSRLSFSLGAPSAATEADAGSLNDPAFGQDPKSADPIGALDEFNVEMRPNFCEPFRKLRSLLSAVGEKRLHIPNGVAMTKMPPSRSWISAG